MNEAGLGSKYLVFPGKMLQIVICSLSGLSCSRQGSMTPWPLSAKPRCFAYHSFICCWFADLKKIPPMPRIRPCWLMVVFLSSDCTGQCHHRLTINCFGEASPYGLSSYQPNLFSMAKPL